MNTITSNIGAIILVISEVVVALLALSSTNWYAGATFGLALSMITAQVVHLTYERDAKRV